eukprot:scaffold1087_cov198-Pinguiococcus_pyrenoidosus.AAC.6
MAAAELPEDDFGGSADEELKNEMVALREDNQALYQELQERRVQETGGGRSRKDRGRGAGEQSGAGQGGQAIDGIRRRQKLWVAQEVLPHQIARM